jgi:Hint domain-containing protein
MVPRGTDQRERLRAGERHSAMARLRLVLAVVALIVAACGGGPTPTPGPVMGLAELKLAIIDRFGPLWYCDPDFWPVAREDEQVLAIQRWGEVAGDADAFAAIAGRLGLDPEATPSDAQKLAAYRLWKILNAIALDATGDDAYRFEYLAQPAAGASEGTRTTGTIRIRGEIEIERQVPAGEPVCPICLARGTAIDTPDGRVPVQDLGIGDSVWTLDVAGRRVAATIIAVGSTVSPASHRVVRLVLVDGRRVTASPGHPLADGRTLGSLRPGDPVGGSRVSSAELVAYASDRTFDVVVSGPTGVYLVDGIPLASTLRAGHPIASEGAAAGGIPRARLWGDG